MLLPVARQVVVGLVIARKAEMQIKIVALNARFTHSCLALFHVRNELEKNCLDVKIELCQLTINDSYYETLLRLSQGGPDYRKELLY